MTEDFGMYAIANINHTSNIWNDKVPSPTGSDDSGLGLSPNSRLRLDSLSDSTLSPQSQNDCNPWSCDSFGKSDSDFQQHPDADLFCLSLLEQKADFSAPIQQQNKKTTPKQNNKKKQPNADNTPSSKLERCFQPKTGNGKPRQTSVKRKQSQRSSTACPYPGVRVLTVREKLKKMRERPSSRTSSTAQSPPSYPCSYNNCQPLQATMPNTPYQQNQNFSEIHPSLTPTNLMNMESPPTASVGQSPLYKPTPTFAPNSFVSNFPYQLESGDLADNYPHSISSNSPPSTPFCSSPQQIPSSPELTSSTQHYHPTISPRNESKSPIQVSYNRLGMDQPAHYQTKVPVQNLFIEDDSLYVNSLNTTPQQFRNQPQFVTFPDLTQFHESARRGELQTLQSLLETGRHRVDEADDSGKTALFHAIEGEQLDAVKLLLNFGADSRFVTVDRSTVVHAAAACQKSGLLAQIMKLLPPEMVPYLVKSSNKSGRTPLHVAAEHKLNSNLNLLLCCGADFQSQDQCGYAPLHIAIQNGDVRTVQSLLQHASNNQKGKDVASQRTLYFSTPLHLSAELMGTGGPDKEEQQLRIIKLLLRCGADIYATDSRKCSPIHCLLPPNESKEFHEARLLLGGTEDAVCVVDRRQSQMLHQQPNFYNGVLPHSQ